MVVRILLPLLNVKGGNQREGVSWERRFEAMVFDRYTKGQGITEYALIFVFVIILLIVLLSIFGQQLGDIYSHIVAEI